MSQTIATVGFEIPGQSDSLLPIESRKSLLDWDIIVVMPDISSFYRHSIDTYKGKRDLSEDGSFRLKESLAHWRREIIAAVEAGKIVVVLLSEVDEVFVATGERQYSGTGRNRQTTRIVAELNNYAMIPVNMNPVSCTGNLMAIDAKATFFAEYWETVGPDSEYRLAIENAKLTPIVHTKTGNRIVGALARDNQSTGALVLVPYIDFDRDSFTYQKDKKTYWSKKGIEFGKRFIASVVKLAVSIKSQSDKTPAPDWVSDPAFELESEKIIRQELLKLESEQHRIASSISSTKERLDDETALKDLLFEKGKPLEKAIIKALRLLGFTANPFRESDSEFDVVFESLEGRLIAEAEGKDTKAINVDKLRQLEMNINEDYQREEISQIAKGVLIGNAYRLSPPTERAAFFTEKCVVAAERSKTALLRSIDLFLVAREYSATKQESIASDFRKKLVEAVGIVSVERTPSTLPSEDVGEGT